MIQIHFTVKNNGTETKGFYEPSVRELNDFLRQLDNKSKAVWLIMNSDIFAGVKFGEDVEFTFGDIIMDMDSLIDRTIAQIATDVAEGDTTAAYELIGYIPVDRLIGYAPDSNIKLVE